MTVNKFIFGVKVLAITLIFSNLVSCNKQKNINSFYIWKSELTLDNNDFEFFRQNNIKNLYIRLFDVTWTNQAEPSGTLYCNCKIPTDFNIIPVVYLSNDVLKNTDIYDIYELSKKIFDQIKYIYTDRFNRKKFKEYQIDCDWTQSTRDKYFSLLVELKKLSDENTKLSVTIRLHQVKYRQSSGVPPVDKGVLMYYNMGDLFDFHEKNSILNNQTGQEYITSATSYPIELSLALPVYSWGAVFRKENFKNILYNFNVNTISDFDFVKNTHDNFYEVTKNTSFDNVFLRKGDVIRLEYANIDELQKAKKICRNLFPKNYEIILYNYNFNNSNLLNKNDLEKIFNRK